MDNVVSLVAATVSSDTIDMLRAQLAAALRGEVVGALLVVHYRGRHYAVDAAGTAKDDTAFSRGTLCKLDDELAKMPARQK